jgi:hypothetical protein
MVGRQVVGHDDVARLERGAENLVDVGQKTFAVHGAVKHTGSGEPTHAQRGDERARLPVALRRVIGDPLPTKPTGIPAEQIGGDPTFIEKDEPRRIERGCEALPLEAGRPNVWPIVFGRAYRFF